MWVKRIKLCLKICPKSSLPPEEGTSRKATLHGAYTGLGPSINPKLGSPLNPKDLL